MKYLKTILITGLINCSLGFPVLAQEGRRHQGPPLPPEIREQLNAEQLQALRTAGSREKEMELLKSWNIQMPERPQRPMMSEEDRAKIDALRAKFAAASTDEEKQLIRQELRALHHQFKLPPPPRGGGDGGATW